MKCKRLQRSKAKI